MRAAMLFGAMVASAAADESDAVADRSAAQPCAGSPGTVWDGSCSIGGEWTLRATAVRHAQLGCARILQPSAFTAFAVAQPSPAGGRAQPGGAAAGLLLPAQRCLRKCTANPDLSVFLREGVFATDGHDCYCAGEQTASALRQATAAAAAAAAAAAGGPEPAPAAAGGLEVVACDGHCSYTQVNPLDQAAGAGAGTCAALLASGIFSCARDFCADRRRCSQAGACDLACDICNVPAVVGSELQLYAFGPVAPPKRSPSPATPGTPPACVSEGNVTTCASVIVQKPRLDAAVACCHCGGGLNNQYGVCADSPYDWSDSHGNSCHDYAARRYCTVHGDYGSGWADAFGSSQQFSLLATAAHSPWQAVAVAAAAAAELDRDATAAATGQQAAALAAGSAGLLWELPVGTDVSGHNALASDRVEVAVALLPVEVSIGTVFPRAST
eukprot:SAG22_NODE_468_length_10147_cov_77.238654_5_plen_441_part_00